MSIRRNKAIYDHYEREALKIGIYAYYRHTFLTHSFPDYFDMLRKKSLLLEDYEDVELVMSAYLDEYRKRIKCSDEYNRLLREKGFYYTYEEYLEKKVDAEEDRMGNRWVCHKIPQLDDLFMEWHARAKLFNAILESSADDDEDDEEILT